jgi:nucleoid DNA-binding protein
MTKADLVAKMAKDAKISKADRKAHKNLSQEGC